MILVHIPAPLRSLTGGRSDVEVEAATLGEMVDSLESLHAGFRARLMDGDRIRTGFAVFVNSNQVSGLLSTRLPEKAEIYLAPAISGGSHHIVFDAHIGSS